MGSQIGYVRFPNLSARRQAMKLMDIMIVVGATILTGGAGYIVVLGHVAKVNHASAYVAVVIAMVGAACLSIGLLLRNRD